MTRRYYSSRSKPRTLDVKGLYSKTVHLYLFFRGKDYFKGKADITDHYTPSNIEHIAAFSLGFQPFPISKWPDDQVTDAKVFDLIEFLYDYVAKPGELVDKVTSTNWQYQDYEDYDEVAGKEEFRAKVNSFLCDYPPGFELAPNGEILALGTDGLQYILDAQLPSFDEANVDQKVLGAIQKWRNRDLNPADRRQAVRELADVFEWLKKTQNLKDVLSRKDESAIFEIANGFSIRHHDPKQKREYDEDIWHAWMFHFYLATYHAVVRLLNRRQRRERQKNE